MTNQPQPGDIGVYEQDGLKMEVRYVRKHPLESDCFVQTAAQSRWLETDDVRWGERLRVEGEKEQP